MDNILFPYKVEKMRKNFTQCVHYVTVSCGKVVIFAFKGSILTIMLIYKNKGILLKMLNNIGRLGVPWKFEIDRNNRLKTFRIRTDIVATDWFCFENLDFRILDMLENLYSHFSMRISRILVLLYSNLSNLVFYHLVRMWLIEGL